MSDVKVSDESAAAALSGIELVRIVQSAASVRTTTQDIANLANFHAPVTVAYAASVTIDLSSYVYSPALFEITLTGNLALNFSNGTAGQVIRVTLIQGGAGSYTWTPGAAIRFSTDITSITLSTTVGKWDRIGFEWRSSKADVTAYNKGYA